MDPPDFEVHFERAAQGLRAALIELLVAAGADPSRPQDISRRFELNKNTAWRLAKIATVDDPVTWVPHVPGQGGLRIALDLLCAGRDVDRLRASVETAFAEFEAMVVRHAGDRKTLELMLGSQRPDAVPPERLEKDRKLSFQGNSATWGVQARTRLAVQFDMPNADDPGMIDIAICSGVLGFRRLRPTGSWPLLHIGGFGGSLADLEPIEEEGYEPGSVPLMREFCSDNLPELGSVPADDGFFYELGPGPVGNAAEVSCVFGKIHRAFAPIVGDEGEVGEHYVWLDGPTERVHFDLFVHRDLGVELPPKRTLYSSMHGRVHYPLSAAEAFHLPCPVDVRSLGPGPPMIATPHVPEYPRMLARVCERIGHGLDEFEGFRVEMTYPPIPTTLVLSYPLLPRG